MLESITIFNKGGLILYQYRASPSLLGAGEGAANSAALTESKLNDWLQQTMLGRKQVTAVEQRHESMAAVTAAARSIAVLVESVSEKDKFAVALYPDILFEGPRSYMKGWIQALLHKCLQEYALYEQAMLLNLQDQEDQDHLATLLPMCPDPKGFDKTFQALLEQSKQQKSNLQQQPPSADNAADKPSTTTTTTASANNKKGKEKRTWGDAKVTKQAMAQLDFSKPDSHTANNTSNDNNNSIMDPSEQAIAEARAAYLPNFTQDDEEEEEETPTLKDDDNSWGSSLQSVFGQMTGNKILTAQDLKVPLEEMQKLLTTKNVAQSVAKEICDSVQTQLVGKRLNSFFRVKTAVRQALEAAITKILNRGRTSKDGNLDIIRAAMTKTQKGMFASSSSTKTKPYVVVNVGINGVGKSTSLAKLAYYFQSHGLKPLLVAGDTFRSGAVEQLNVHAKCLQVPMFQQGYAKDPSAVAKAAIAQVMAQDDDNDDNDKPNVVLIDTAGRMQNNAPLMAALGKLVTETQPDLILLVAEALVGNDGVTQLQMFNRAMQSAQRQIDAVILSKFDTVSDKVGAALTLTHITGAPILFVGTGQKYHHLKRLQAATVIQSLFA
ncbi:particle receptor subunit alpha [Seminavis robusta]|uniref:Signal recognition particle receptor subunit alpha homolog n=1 Tax=Seminavis robusta TaxID=568900 RepID=A0A9N8E536_9STRA|nr:particle receptor subunit alpha [Seminavis robusta]|eukprot:Sro669_g184500.1 particle receptor subunit alpha (608) ;mRNA; f:16400-18223